MISPLGVSAGGHAYSASSSHFIIPKKTDRKCSWFAGLRRILCHALKRWIVASSAKGTSCQ